MSAIRASDGEGAEVLGAVSVPSQSAAPEIPTAREAVEQFKETVLTKLALAVDKDPSSATSEP